jgi:hypothetical protein
MATRTPALIGHETLRVEALPVEEIEENLTVQPGNLSLPVNELPGVRVQSAPRRHQATTNQLSDESGAGARWQSRRQN